MAGCGRLYLVVQCACLAVTIFLFVRFLIEDRELEMTEIQDTRMLYRISIQEGKGWTLPTRDEQPRLYESIEQTRSAHNQGQTDETPLLPFV